MKVILKTKVRGHYKDVIRAFDRKLFNALLPKAGGVELIEFTGSETGDRVHLRFRFPFRLEWVSVITEHGEDDEQAFFIDEGETLPGILSYWRHKHLVMKVDEHHSVIIDEMHYRAHIFPLTLLLYPAIYFGFFPRKKIYRSYFDLLYQSRASM